MKVATTEAALVCFLYSDAQLSFVSSRLGSAWTADPLENLSLDIPTRRLAE
jgi:hypothetical protein